jgi:hypothetical protein
MLKVILKKLSSNFTGSISYDKKTCFTQFTVADNISAPCDGFNNKCIDGNKLDLLIDGASFVDSIKERSFEGQILTGKELIIIGHFECKIFCHQPGNIKKCFTINKKLPFSTFIVVPIEVCTDSPINLSYYIEDITAAVLSKGKIFVAVSLLLNYENEYILE